MPARAKIKPVHGAGINDADYPVTRYERVGGKSKRVWTCPFYRKWESMLNRCYSERYLFDKPTYRECQVATEWHSFMNFREWMNSQEWHGKVLDKDILFPGNKIYSPSKCIFITAELNSFTTDSGAVRGEYPIGVFFNQRNGLFESHCNNPFTKKYELLGRYSSPDQAHFAWLARKSEHAHRYAAMQSDPRVAAALIARYKHGYEEAR